LICLTGASCALDGIEEIFSDHFEIDATRIDLSAPFGFSKPDKKAKGETSLSLEGGTAVGLALKAMGVDHAGMDFRQEEFGYKGTFEVIKRGMACALTLLFAFMFLYAFNLKSQLREKNNALLGVKTMQKNLYTVLFPSLQDLTTDHLPLSAEGRYFTSLDAQKRRLAQKFGAGGGATRARYSSLLILKEFSAAVETAGTQWGIEVIKVTIDPLDNKTSYFDCTSSQQNAGVAVSTQLQDNELFETRVGSAAIDRRSGKWNFQVQIKVKTEEDVRG
jgi:hypothetical protein